MTEQAALSRFQGEKIMSLETYRRNGEPVHTPVRFLEEDRILYVHTDDSTGKYGLQATLTRFIQRFSRSKANDIIIVIHPS